MKHGQNHCSRFSLHKKTRCHVSSHEARSGNKKNGKEEQKVHHFDLQELSLRKSFFFDKKYESPQGKEPPCSLLELYFSQKGYFLLAPLHFMTAYVTPGLKVRRQHELA